MTPEDIRAAAAWAVEHGYTDQEHLDALNDAAEKLERGELSVTGSVHRDCRWSDVIEGLYRAGVDILELREVRQGR